MTSTLPPVPPPRLRPSGFSLVEVTLALGIAAFCLVVMLGVFGSVIKLRGDNVARKEAFLAAYALQGQMTGPDAFAEVYQWVRGGSKELIYVRYKADSTGAPDKDGERYRAAWIEPDDLTGAMESAFEGRWVKARLSWDDRDHVNPVPRGDLPANMDEYHFARATLQVALFAVASPSVTIADDQIPSATTSLTLTR